MDGRQVVPHDEGQQLPVLLPHPGRPTARYPKALGWESGWAHNVEVWASGGHAASAPETAEWAVQVLNDLLEHQKRTGTVQYHIVGHVWLTQRLLAAARELSNLITLDPGVRGGVPVVSGTRLPLARIFAEVADDRLLSEIADDHELPADMLMQLFGALAASLERPFTR